MNVVGLEVSIVYDNFNEVDREDGIEEEFEGGYVFFVREEFGVVVGSCYYC